MKQMKAYWQFIAARFDALSLRERMLVFAVASGLLFVLMDSLFLASVRNQQKILAREILGSASRTKAIDAQIMALRTGQQTDPDAEDRKKLEALKQQLAKTDASLQGMQQSMVAPEKMGKLLEDLLAQNRHLNLISMKTLPVANFRAEKTTEATQGVKSAEKASLLYKHGVEITVEGSYGDLLAYLTSVEQLPWRMFWGGITLHTGAYPKAGLTLTLYTLSLNKAWLSV